MAAALAYFDSSVLVKRYVDEPGSAHARRLMRQYRLLSSVIAPVEVASAVGRRYRAGELSQTQFDAITGRLRSERANWELVELGSRVLEGAERLVEDKPVRTLDALHIASALIIQKEYGTMLPFATADERQREAAGGAGLRVLWVDGSRGPRA